MTTYPEAPFPQNPRKSLFIASWPDPLVLKQLTEFQAGLMKAAQFTPCKAKWIPTEKMHLTFHFLGECDEATEQKIRAILVQLPEKSPFPTRLQGLGYFPHSKAPTTLWLGVHEQEKKMTHLHKTLGRELLSIGCTLPNHDFTPHITLARFPSLRGTGALTSVLQSYQPKQVAQWNVRTIDLVESCLSQEGPYYKRILTVPLYS